MKKRILKLSLTVLFLFGFCTVTSMHAEELLVPQVSVVAPRYRDDRKTLADVPISCLRTEANGTEDKREKGIWAVQEYENMWGEIEYQVVFLTNCIMEEHDDYMVVQYCPKYVVQDALRPLQDGEKVRMIK